MKKIIFITIVFSCSVCSICYSAPSVSSITGTVENGQTITINGTGFGDNTGAVPVLCDFFDAEAIDTDDWDVTQMIPTTNGQRSSNSTRCITGDFNDNYKVAVDSRVDSGVGYGDKFYVSWWQKCGDDWDWDESVWDNYKIIINAEKPDSASEGCHFLLNELSGMKFYNNSGVGGTAINLGVSLKTIQTVDSWVHHEMWIKCPSTDNTSTDATAYWSYDGTSVKCLDGTEGLDWWGKDDSTHGDNVANNMANIRPAVIGGLFSTGTAKNNSNVYIDDFYHSASWKRVTIGNNSSGYGNEVSRVISWSDTQIEIEVYAGAFDDLSGKELVVFDENGLVDSYTIGSTPPTPCTELSNLTLSNIDIK